jgi:hypothetical protein
MSDIGGTKKPTARHLQVHAAAFEEGPCPCESGKAFCECCRPILNDAGGLEAQPSDWKEAERQDRAQFVRYLQWVQEHTIPLAKLSARSATLLIRIDLDALEELCDRVAMALARQGREAEIIPYLHATERRIPLPEFACRATYLRSLWTYLALKDVAAARVELAKLGDLSGCDHRRTLELAIDLNGLRMPIRQRLHLSERILSLAEGDRGIQIQYLGLKAVSLLTLGEVEEASKVLQVATAMVPAGSPSSFKDIEFNLKLARALAIRAHVEDDPGLTRAAEHLLVAIPTDSFTPAGRSAFLMDLGRVQTDAGNFTAAAASFAAAAEAAPDPLAKVKWVLTSALAGDWETSAKVLDSIDDNELEPEYRLEYLEAVAALSMTRGDKVKAHRAVELLEDLEEPVPYFAEHRNRLVIELLEFIRAPSEVERKKVPPIFVTVASWLSRYGHLKPNFMGVGVNVNQILDDLVKRSKADQ